MPPPACLAALQKNTENKIKIPKTEEKEIKK